VDQQALLRKIPKMDELWNLMASRQEIALIEPVFAKDELRQVLQALRETILQQEGTGISEKEISHGSIIEKTISRCVALGTMQLRKVINGTGVVLHTNLGRAPLGDYVKDALWDIAKGYSNLEMDLNTGKRGSRYSHMKELLLKLTGAEDAIVVNNNAGAVLLTLSALTKGKEVVISRGELVEIGGSFRVPEVMEQSGATLVEVGATNKAYVRDYEAAVTELTGALLKVHQSNFKIVGFTHEATPEELVTLAGKYKIPMINDLGSGLFINLTPYGFPPEPTVQEAVGAGCDVVTFSGDKLLGGAQAGIIAGKKKWIQIIAKHPLTRALRVDKLTLCALEATLKLYLDPEEALHRIPALKMMTQSTEALEERAGSLLEKLTPVIGENRQLKLSMVTDTSQVGGGAYPTVQLESRLIRFEGEAQIITRLERFLRQGQPAIIGRIQDNAYLLDLRTLFDDDVDSICQAFQQWINRE
jgi:L-seryl-tRNA(Ser) seleniumtransferase